MQTTMDFTAARKRGHDAGDAAAKRAGDPWVEQAVEVLARYALHFGHEPFTIEEARSLFADKIDAPADQRAWGHVSRKAERLGYIRRVPGQFRATVSSNGSPKPLYTAAL